MVDWKQLAEEWNKISVDLRNKIIASMRQKFNEDKEKFTEWLKQDPGRQIIWSTYAGAKEPASTPPPAEVAKKVMVSIQPSAAPRVMPSLTKGLTDTEKKLLLDEWNNVFFRVLGKVPPNSSSTFRVELQKVINSTYKEALEHILNIAQDIIDEIKAREIVRRAPVFKPLPTRREQTFPRAPPEIGIGEGGENPIAPGSRVPPAQFPGFSVDYNLPFPRGPTSRERMRIWNAFLYQMQQQGYDGFNYQRQFDDYIANTQFLSWEDLREKYNFFVKTIMAGQELPPLFTWRGAPIPTGLKGTIQEGTELEQLRDLLVHYTSVVIRNARSMGEIATIEDLKDALVERGIIPAETSLPELRSSVRSAWNVALERKDLWTVGISATEINDLLAGT